MKSLEFSHCLNEIYQKFPNTVKKKKVIQTKYLNKHKYVSEIFKASKNKKDQQKNQDRI